MDHRLDFDLRFILLRGRCGEHSGPRAMPHMISNQ
jgi:hypothetical protein